MSALPEIIDYPLPTNHELPPNVADWTVAPDRAVLLIHDMQQYFLRSLPEGLRERLVTNIAELRKRCDELGIRIAYTQQPGAMSAADRGLLQAFWGPGMRGDGADREVIADLRPADGDWVFTKWRYSAFVRSDLLERMRHAGRDQLIVCGVYAHIGVLTTAVDAFSNDIQTFLVADAVADFSAEHHRIALDIAARKCAVVTTCAEVLAERGA
ncbi:isochorismatase family protein [Nocardia huaxiensis]|uniref:Isochorismatase family protein n=1 Tax=Nocardia huaxiensis TaxID=2755382 RepID=A0A7D6ZED9_9NOCA|nr:isochorismatase family protein [Nocardia huaxiensis]UFS99513.1 isochorismatase family protein [Nocardia huaxiensis]